MGYSRSRVLLRQLAGVIMNTDDFSDLLVERQAKHPIWFELPGDEPADDLSLNRLEDELGARFPLDYRWFLKALGGGDFAFVAIYSADQASDLLITRNQPDVPVPFVAVTDDGTGNLIGFPVVEGVCADRIMEFDHESGEIRPTGHGGFLDFVAEVGLRRSDAT